jgi:hypothetical protein
MRIGNIKHMDTQILVHKRLLGLLRDQRLEQHAIRAVQVSRIVLDEAASEDEDRVQRDYVERWALGVHEVDGGFV